VIRRKRESVLTGYLMVKIGPGVNLPTMLEKIKKLYERYNPTNPFDYSFLDEDFNMRYKAEDNLAGILNVFTGLTVLIACLGLFGLAAFLRCPEDQGSRYPEGTGSFCTKAWCCC